MIVASRSLKKPSTNRLMFLFLLNYIINFVVRKIQYMPLIYILFIFMLFIHNKYIINTLHIFLVSDSPGLKLAKKLSFFGKSNDAKRFLKCKKGISQNPRSVVGSRVAYKKKMCIS